MHPKVLNVYRTYFPDPPGGLQEAIRQICATTTTLGVDNTVFTLSPKPEPREIEMAEARVVRAPSLMAPASCDIGGRAAFSSYQALHKETDVVHLYYPWPFADVLHLASRLRKPAVMTYISDIVRQKYWGQLYRPLMWKTLASMDVIVANCEAYVASSSVLSHPLIRPKVKIIPLGIDEDTYAKKIDPLILGQLGLSKATPFFLFLGVLRYYKGLHTLIEAAKHVDARIVIAGSGPNLVTFKKQAEALGLKNVVFAGQVTHAEKMALLESCLALVLPSHLRSEGFGMVLVEASMMGKPMISCEIGTGTSYVNLNEVTGLVVPPEDPVSLASAMQALLLQEGSRLKMGEAARDRYVNEFSGPVLGKAYYELYLSMS